MQLLISYPCFPEFDKNSGALRLFEITKALVRRGHQVSFWALNESEPKYRMALEDLGVRCFAGQPEADDGSLGQLRKFLVQSNPELAILVHHFVFSTVIPTIRSLSPRCHCVLDTVDLHYVRERRSAELSGQLADREKANASYRKEWAALHEADSVWVVSAIEAEQLRKDGLPVEKSIAVIGNVHTAMDGTRPADQRKGIVFIGAYKHSPNVDAVDFYMEQVYPLIVEDCPDAEFTIAGSDPPSSFQEYASIPGVRVTGFVEDHRQLLESHLVAVFAAEIWSRRERKDMRIFVHGNTLCHNFNRRRGHGFGGRRRHSGCGLAHGICCRSRSVAKRQLALVSTFREWETLRDASALARGRRVGVGPCNCERGPAGCLEHKFAAMGKVRRARETCEALDITSLGVSVNAIGRNRRGSPPVDTLAVETMKRPHHCHMDSPSHGSLE